MKKVKPDLRVDSSSPENPPSPLRSSLWIVLACLWALVVGIYYFRTNKPDFSSLASMVSAFDFPTASACFVSFGHILLAGWLGLLAFLIGRLFLRRFRTLPRASLEAVLFSSGVGAGMMTALLFVLGVLGLWYKAVLWALCLIATGLASAANRDLWKRKNEEAQALQKRAPSKPVLDKILIGLLATTLTTYLAEALAPEIFYDSLVYHLAIPQLWLLHHQMIPTPMNCYAGIPFNMEILYGLALALSDGVLAKLMHYMAGLGTLGVIYAVAKRYGSSRAGYMACLLFCSTPMVAMQFCKTAVELGSSFFGLLAFLALLWSGEGLPSEIRRRGLILAGLFAGLAMGTKYTAWVLLPALCVMHAVLWWGQTHRSAKAFFIEQGMLVFCATLAVSPWVIKNIYFYQNPLFPLHISFFRNPDKGVFDWAGLQADTGVRQIAKEFSSWKGVLSYILEPWRMTMYGHSNADFLGPDYLVFLPWLICVRWRRTHQALLWAFFVEWFLCSLFSHLVRFWIPALAVLAILLGISLVDRSFPSSIRDIALAALIGISVMNLLAAGLVLYSMDGWKVVFGLVRSSDYLSETHKSYPMPYYRAADFINRRTLPSTKVMILGDARGFYVERPFVAASVFDRHPLLEFSNASQDGEELYRRLKNLAITHVLINAAEAFRVRSYPAASWPLKAQAVFDDFWQRHVHLVFQDQNTERGDFRWTLVYEVVPDRSRLESGGSHLPNVFLEILQKK